MPTILRWVLEQVAAHARRPLVVGLNAPQGAGKTTLAKALIPQLASHGLRAISFSIDDFYLRRAEQLALAAAYPADRLLEHRGYPGTHDLKLGVRTLQALREGRDVELPRYDKSAHAGRGDRSATSERVTGRLDVVLFDGWMLGFQPVPCPPAALATVNEKLASYASWHELLDVMIWLRADDPLFVVEWRSQAEDAARADGRPALSRADIEDYARRFSPAYLTWSVQGPWPRLELRIGRDRQLRA